MYRIIYIILLISFSSLNIGVAQDAYKMQRRNMVQTQISERGITSPAVLKSLSTVPRHLFVPAEFREFAYEDHPMPIGEGQTISQPYIVALMTELLNAGKGDRVLEIGTGSGYQAAVLSGIVSRVFTIEIFESLYRRSSFLLDSLDYGNIECRHGDGYAGWKEEAPFDAIIVTCSPSEVPEPLTNQLAEGGRMVIPVGNRYIQELVVLRKRKGKLKQERIAPVRFVPMIREDGRRYD